MSFKFRCLRFMLIVASSVEVWGSEVETLEEQLYVNSSLGTRVSIDQICRDYELEILGILLTVDLRVMDISKFDVVLRMDRFTTHRAIIDCEHRRVTAYTQDGTCVTF